MNSFLALPPLAMTLLSASAAQASNYPPSYDTCSIDDYAYTGPFELIKNSIKFSGHAQLTVAYRGYLRELFSDDEINVWIRINGNDAMVPAAAGNYDDAYILIDSGPRNCVWCAPNMPYTPELCEGLVLPPNSSGSWECEDPTPTEDHLFLWAFDEWDHQNAWDIELAAEAGGQWDSNWGGNFHARFEPRNSCN